MIPTINFGLSGYAQIVLYIGFLVVVGLTLFWRPVVGIYYLAPIIPAQTIRDRMADYPLGGSVVTIVMLAVAIGLLMRGEPIFPRSKWRVPMVLYMTLTFVSLCFGTVFLGRSFPMPWSDPRFVDWRNYFTMLFLLFITAAAIKTTKQMKILLAIVCLGILIFNRGFWNEVRERDFSDYNEDSRDAGGSGYAGVNGFAAFEAQTAVLLLGISGFVRQRKYRWSLVALAIFSGLCLMYSLSRGGYVGLAAGCIFLGVVKYRKLLVLMAVFAMTWTAIVPGAVVQRVYMTENDSGNLDHSSETRVSLWEEALEEVAVRPILGFGFNTYAYMDHLRGYRDAHNVYLKFLVETGYVGLALFLWMLGRFMTASIGLFRKAVEPFHKGLGLGLAAWVVAALASNVFGDRFTYLQIAGYMFMFGGMAARAYVIEAEAAEEGIDLSEDGDAVEADEEEMESVGAGVLQHFSARPGTA